MANYSRAADGLRFELKGGLNTVKSPDLLAPGEFAYLQNVRAYLQGRITGRALAGPALAVFPAPPNTILRMNDTTPSGPVSGYVRIIGAAGVMYVNNSGGQVASGLSGNPMIILPNQPDQSVQPWAYVADPSQAVTISATGQACTGMVKVRSDGLTRKTGIKEPQVPPLVTVNTVSVSEYLTLPANTPPWTNIGGANADYNYSGTDVQPPYPTKILTPIAGATVTLTVTGTATVNGSSHAPGDAGPTTTGYPGAFITTPKIVVYAFTDASGNVIAQSGVVGDPPVLGNVGAGAVLTVPQGAAQLQIGIDSQGGHFSSNSGSYLVLAVVSTASIPLATATVGNVTAYIWGDSPHSGPVASYVWKNPNDSGTGIARAIGTAQVTSVNNSLIIDSTPEDGTVPSLWSTLNPAGATIGSINLFSPALESDGYQDFNACIVGSLYFPAAGTYAVQFKNKDQVMFGMGGGVTGQGGKVFGAVGQTITVANGYPLLFVSAANGSGGQVTTNFNIRVPGPGVYPFEIDWDYWYHSGKSMIVNIAPTPGAGVLTVPPLPYGVRTGVQYWNKYRAAETGAPSNPGPASPIQITPVLANLITSPFSIDPQVTKVDYYRQDDTLANPTYVATGPNDGLGGTINGVVYNTPVQDVLSSLVASENPIMATDDFEPFPSIDTPKSGFVSIIDGVINWVSGDKFNTRWLPGTEIQVGFPTQTAYVLTARPISTTQIVIAGIYDTIGLNQTGVPYNIAQPILAQQPLPSMWGPDAYGFFHACGDPNQPGAYVWTKAYNPDSAPQTNRLLVASASEMLMGGELVNGISMVFSSQRAWLMYPNFADAQATSEGIVGNQWNPILAIATRGLYIRNCLVAIGGKRIAFRAYDGISITTGGGETSLTDERLYNLFPHENFTPTPVNIGGFTIYPPNDSLPQALRYQAGYIYFDYYNISGQPCTLVYDEAAKGWSVDVGQLNFTCHASEYGVGVRDTAVGCLDGSLRVLQSGGTEVCTSVVLTGAQNNGDARSNKSIGDIFIKALVGNPVSVNIWANRFVTQLAGYTNAVLAASPTLKNYIVDWSSGQPPQVTDIAIALSWLTGGVGYLDLWQPTFISQAETIQGQTSDFTDCGMVGNKLIQGLHLELNTFGSLKTFQIQRSDDYSLFTPIECPVSTLRHILGFTFNPPFLANMVRRVSTDGVPWQAGPNEGWVLQYLFQPYPDSSKVWIAEATSFGKLGYQHCYQVNLAYIATAPVVVTLTTDQGTVSQTFPATNTPSLVPAKILMKMPFMKWKTCEFSAESGSPFYLWKDLCEMWVKQWGSDGPYSPEKPFGGDSNIEGGAQI
jgi:hypothetical protein